jgi:hypothetical protein
MLTWLSLKLLKHPHWSSEVVMIHQHYKHQVLHIGKERARDSLGMKLYALWLELICSFA